MNILVTGGAGFIGSHLADKLLNENHKVFVIDNFNNYYNSDLKEQNILNNLNNSNYKIFRADICDEDVLDSIFSENQIDSVVHLAGYAGVGASLESPLEYIKTNIFGTVNLLEKMKEYNIKKIVFASSSSVYGNCNEECFSECLKTSEPISPYAATKLSCEQFLYTYYKLYGINTVILRFFTVYGPRQRPDLAIRKFTDLIIKDKEVPVHGDGSALRDYTYIDDIISGIYEAIKYDKTPYEIINLGANNPISINTMIKNIEKTLNKKAKIKYIPMPAQNVYKTSSNIQKAKELLNYIPKINFETGIKNFIEWYLAGVNK